MPKCRKVACTAFLVAMMGAPALAISPAQPEPPLWEFGVWTIRQQSRAKDSLRLVGRHGDGHPGIEVECHVGSTVVGIFVTLEPDPSTSAAAPFQVTVWNERGRQSASRFPRVNATTGFVLFDRNQAGDGPPGIHSLFSTLRHAKKFFALKVAGVKRQFDARELNAAFLKFESACRELR